MYSLYSQEEKTDNNQRKTDHRKKRIKRKGNTTLLYIAEIYQREYGNHFSAWY